MDDLTKRLISIADELYGCMVFARSHPPKFRLGHLDEDVDSSVKRLRQVILEIQGGANASTTHQM